MLLQVMFNDNIQICILGRGNHNENPVMHIKDQRGWNDRGGLVMLLSGEKMEE